MPVNSPIAKWDPSGMLQPERAQSFFGVWTSFFEHWMMAHSVQTRIVGKADGQFLPARWWL